MKPFSCSVCEKRFTQEGHMKRHMETHKVEIRNKTGCLKKSKTCSICLKTFPTPSKLERHVLVHLGIKPFACNLCDRRFTQEIHLKTHMKISHKYIFDARRQEKLLSSNHPSTRNKAKTEKKKTKQML